MPISKSYWRQQKKKKKEFWFWFLLGCLAIIPFHKTSLVPH